MNLEYCPVFVMYASSNLVLWEVSSRKDAHVASITVSSH